MCSDSRAWAARNPSTCPRSRRSPASSARTRGAHARSRARGGARRTRAVVGVGPSRHGKSRLYEFLESCRAAAQRARGRAVAHSKSIPLIPTSKLRSYFAIGEATTTAARARRSRAACCSRRRLPTVAVLSFLGVADPGSAAGIEAERPAPSLRCVRRLLSSHRRRPAAADEDLHWPTASEAWSTTGRRHLGHARPARELPPSTARVDAGSTCRDRLAPFEPEAIRELSAISRPGPARRDFRMRSTRAAAAPV